MIKKTVLFCLLSAVTFTIFAQEKTIESNYDPHALFSPFFYPTGETITRSANGAPNVGYWQNRADYQITSSLNDITHQITGSVTITYKNNSPHTLPFLWLQLDQNLFNKDSRGQARMPVDSRSRYGDAKSGFNGGYIISKVQLNDGVANYIITDSRMQIRLPKPMNAGGDVVKIKIDYTVI